MAQRRCDEIINFAAVTEPAVDGPESGGRKCRYYYCDLSGGDVFGLWALGAIGNLHGHRLTLLKRFMTFSLYRAVMYENVFSTFLRNKAIAFGIVKPLNRACYCFRHNFTL